MHPAPDNLAFVVKWLHLASITGVAGGILFAWLFLASSATAETGAWKRFGITIGGLWVVVLLTGFTNMYLVTPKVNAAYQGLLGIKVAIALAMFLVTMMLAHPFPAIRGLMARRGPWLGALVLGAIVVLALSAYLNLSRISGGGLKRTHALIARMHVT